VNGEITIDSNWRWVHDKNGYTNCYSGNSWDTDICKDPKTCASNCAVDGAAYAATYGASTSGNALTLKFITEGEHCRFIVCPLGGGVRGVADHDCQLPTLDRVCT
jgi:cellulose 1,4-beta-cellobiosidase